VDVHEAGNDQKKGKGTAIGGKGDKKLDHMSGGKKRRGDSEKDNAHENG